MNAADSPIQKHHGRNVKRLREIMGIKQETLAAELGINQQKMSYIEGKENVEKELMEQIAKALKVPIEAIENFNEEKAVNIIANSFTGESSAYVINYKCTFNPIESWIEVMNENKKLQDQLLQSEREKVALLEKMLASKN
jgi:transcriptional regulator with XRE-family HTH domain